MRLTTCSQLIAANLFVVAFSMSWGPVVWVLLSEMHGAPQLVPV